MPTPTRKPRTPAPAPVVDPGPTLHPAAIIYEDGHEDHVANLYAPKVMVALEQEGYSTDEGGLDTDRLRSDHGTAGAMMYIAWTALGRPGKTFAEWSATIAGFSVLDAVPFGRVARQNGSR